MERLSEAPWAVLNGISGIGKSAIAAHVAKTLEPGCDHVLWVDAGGMPGVAGLSDLDVRRNGTHHNVASLLRRRKCLLVLDDARLPSGALRSVDFGASKVIVTCQTSDDPFAIAVGDLDAVSARALLESEAAEPCPEPIFARVLKSVGGHPLLLRALGEYAREDGWGAVDACCADAVSGLEDDRSQKVCRRILMRHEVDLATELQFVRWCDDPRIDAELTRACISNLGIRNLRKRAFLAATGPGDLRVHDVVYRSIRAVVQVSSERDREFRERMDAFIREDEQRDGVLARRVARVHAALVLRLLQRDQRPSFVYAAALSRAANTPLDVLGDPVVAARALSRAVAPGRPCLSVRSGSASRGASPERAAGDPSPRRRQ